MEKVLWDYENDEPAINYDGTEPEIFGDVVLIKELGCNCNEPATCGGCADIIRYYDIGPDKQYRWLDKRESDVDAELAQLRKTIRMHLAQAEALQRRYMRITGRRFVG